MQVVAERRQLGHVLAERDLVEIGRQLGVGQVEGETTPVLLAELDGVVETHEEVVVLLTAHEPRVGRQGLRGQTDTVLVDPLEGLGDPGVHGRAFFRGHEGVLGEPTHGADDDRGLIGVEPRVEVTGDLDDLLHLDDRALPDVLVGGGQVDDEIAGVEVRAVDGVGHAVELAVLEGLGDLLGRHLHVLVGQVEL